MTTPRTEISTHSEYHDSSLIRKMGLQGVYITPLHISIMGSMSGAAVFSRLWHWASVMHFEPFYKGDAELMEESLCSDWELRQAKKRLKELSFISIERKGVPATTWYTFDLASFGRVLQTAKVKFPPPQPPPTHELVRMKPTNCTRENLRTIYNKDNNKKNTIHTLETPGGVPKDVDGDMSSSSGGGINETPPPKQSESSPPKANELHPRWKRWALKLHDAVFQRTHVDRKRHLSQWAKQLSLLHKIDKVSLPRIRRTLDWYCAAVVKNDDPYLPQGFSGQTFREKFAGIESKMNPAGKPAQSTIQFVQIVDGESKPEDDDLLFFEEEPKE